MNTTTPAVTIGIPFFNTEDTLEATIRSVFAQTFQDWELLLLDDGSTDGSADLVRSIRDERVRLISGRVCRGIGYRLNQLTSAARAPLLARMDGDDLMHPRRIEVQVRYLQEHPEVDLVATNACVVNDAMRPLGMRENWYPDTFCPRLLEKSPFIHPSVMARKPWFVANPYRPDYPRSQDHELWLRTFTTSRCHIIEEPLLFYRGGRANANPAKYSLSCKDSRRLVREYGPRNVGYAGTCGALARSFAKEWLFRLAAVAGLQYRLLWQRNRPLTESEIAEAVAALRMVAETEIPGLTADLRENLLP